MCGDPVAPVHHEINVEKIIRDRFPQCNLNLETIRNACGLSFQGYIVSQDFKDLDHPADVGIHAWGYSLEDAFIQAGMALFAYMTDIRLIEPKMTHSFVLENKNSNEELLYSFLDELLFLYGSNYFIGSKIKISRDNQVNILLVEVSGDEFDSEKHTQGTEVKAITYHGMKVDCETIQMDSKDIVKYDVYVLIDI